MVHLPDRTITQWANRNRWRAERAKAFPGTEHFWGRQEMLAEAAWDIASRPFPWPPQSPRELAALAAALRPRSVRAALFLLHAIADLAPRADPLYTTFLDAQLLISAQTTAARANALYGSAALDLPRRGVNRVRGGIGGLARTLVDWIRANGGEVLFRQEVEHVEVKDGLQ